MSDAGSGRTWDDFTTLLVGALEELTLGEILRLEAQDAALAGAPAPIVRAYFIRHARHRARVAVGGWARASLRHEARLAGAGWRPPSPWAGPDHYIDGDFVAVDQLATSLVFVLRDVWHLTGPGTLRWTGRGSERFEALQAPRAHRLGA